MVTPVPRSAGAFRFHAVQRARMIVVEKIDRPKPVEPWRINATAQSTDQEQKQEQSGQAEDEYSSPGTPLRWQKFHATDEQRRLLRIPRERIAHCWFRRVTLRRQIAILEGVVELTDGTQHHGVQMLLPRFDDYFQFKGYAVGQEIPLLTHLHEPVIELSVPIHTPRTGQPAAPLPANEGTIRRGARWWQLIDPHTDQLRLGTLALYAAVALGLIVLLLVNL